MYNTSENTLEGTNSGKKSLRLQFRVLMECFTLAHTVYCIHTCKQQGVCEQKAKHFCAA